LGWVVVGYVDDLSRQTPCQSTILSERIYQASKGFDQRTADAYLGAGVRCTEGFCDKVLWHGCPLRQRGDSVNAIIDFGFVQLVGSKSGRNSSSPNS
jgi:hypothetical protein